MRHEAGVGRHGGEAFDRRFGFLEIVVGAARKERLDENARHRSAQEHFAGLEVNVDDGARQFDGTVRITGADLLLGRQHVRQQYRFGRISLLLGGMSGDGEKSEAFLVPGGARGCRCRRGKFHEPGAPA